MSPHRGRFQFYSEMITLKSFRSELTVGDR